MAERDHRKHRRKRLVVNVDWRVIGSNDVIWSRTNDISAGGLRVRTLTPPDEGDEVLVDLTRRNHDGESFLVLARVAWVRMDEEFCGMGLAFEPDTEKDKARIREILRTLRGRKSNEEP